MRFTYVATTEKGNVIRGDVDALTLREAIRAVRAQGLLLTDIRPFVRRPSLLAQLAGRIYRVSLLQVVLLARHLALLLRAGITLDRSFEILMNQTTRRGLKATLRDVLEAIRRGEALTAALRRHPQVFPERFVAMVQWGEAGGRLPESLEHLATQLEHDRELQARVRGAMVYPLIVVGAVVLIGGVMAIFVLPQLVDIVESFDVELPLATRIFLSVAKAFTGYGLVMFPLAIVGLFTLGLLFRAEKLRPFLHRLFLRLPVVGKIVRMVNLARFDRAFGSLIQSGIPIVESLAIVRGILGNVLYQRAIEGVTADVRKGVSLGTSLKKHVGLFPPIEIDMTAIGEETGKLDEVLLYLAEFYEGNVNQITKNLSQAIEPILLIVIGVVVGGVALAVLMPIYQISEAIV